MACMQSAAGPATAHTVQVVNAVRDLLDGKLSRIWVRKPLQQLLTALDESILRLPDCRLRTEYVHGAALAIKGVVDAGPHLRNLAHTASARARVNAAQASAKSRLVACGAFMASSRPDRLAMLAVAH